MFMRNIEFGVASHRIASLAPDGWIQFRQDECTSGWIAQAATTLSLAAGRVSRHWLLDDVEMVFAIAASLGARSL